MEKRIVNAFRGDSFPCNPRPFLNALQKHVRENGSGSIRDEECRAALLVLIQLAYWQSCTVDTENEYARLEAVLDGKEPPSLGYVMRPDVAPTLVAFARREGGAS